MKKVYYEYDMQRRVFRRIYPTLRQRLLTYALRTLGIIVSAGVVFLLFYLLVPTPSVEELRDENLKLQARYQDLSRKVDGALEVLNAIEQRDDNLYRVLLESEPVSEHIRQSGYSGTNRYSELMDMSNSSLVVSIAQRVDLLEKKLYVQTKSFNDVVDMYRDNAKRIDCIPSIQPVSNKDLKRTASGYGYRIDPIYHVRKFHAGMDFTCPTGTPVYATGNGRVVSAKWRTGFGNCIEINHGYGYVTLYAHLSRINVKVGQTVSRGEVIGKAGSTGKSTGPHVHYEVLLNGKNLNPINYYFMDLDADEYEQMVQMSENQGRVYD